MPSPKLSLCTAIAFVAMASTTIVRAEENFVKPEATPAPKAGPTVSAAQEFCGDPVGKAEELIQLYSTKSGLKQVYKSADYIAFADDDKQATMMYTFTIKGHAAHPAIVCRKMVKEGDFVVGKMSVVCDGGAEACERLRNDFNVLNASAQIDVDNKIKGGADKK